MAPMIPPLSFKGGLVYGETLKKRTAGGEEGMRATPIQPISIKHVKFEDNHMHVYSQGRWVVWISNERHAWPCSNCGKVDYSPYDLSIYGMYLCPGPPGWHRWIPPDKDYLMVACSDRCRVRLLARLKTEDPPKPKWDEMDLLDRVEVMLRLRAP